MSKLFFLVGLTILAVAAARVVREAPTTGNEFSFENFLASMQTGVNNLETNFLKATGSSDSEDFKKKAEEYFGTVAKKWDSWAKDAELRTKDMENVPVVKEVRGSIQKVMDEFSKEHPAVAEDVNKYLGKLKEGTEDVMTKIKAMGDSEESKKVRELSESLLSSAQEQFSSMANELKTKFKATSS